MFVFAFLRKGVKKHYEIDKKEIGKGKFATVKHAIHRQTRKEYALKTIYKNRLKKGMVPSTLDTPNIQNTFHLLGHPIVVLTDDLRPVFDCAEHVLAKSPVYLQTCPADVFEVAINDQLFAIGRISGAKNCDNASSST